MWDLAIGENKRIIPESGLTARIMRGRLSLINVVGAHPLRGMNTPVIKSKASY